MINLESAAPQPGYHQHQSEVESVLLFQTLHLFPNILIEECFLDSKHLLDFSLENYFLWPVENMLCYLLTYLSIKHKTKLSVLENNRQNTHVHVCIHDDMGFFGDIPESG